MNKNELKLGPELELLVLDEDCNVANGSPEIIEDTNSRYVYKERTHNMIEIGCDPSSNLDQIRYGLGRNLQSVVEAAHRKGLRVAPITTLATNFSPEVKADPYYQKFPKVFGPGNKFMCHSLAAHVHVDLEPGNRERLRQMHLATALDPSFVFMAESFTYNGLHKFNDSRVHFLREHAYEVRPQLVSLIPYQPSMEAYQELFRHNFDWLNQRFDQEGIELTKESKVTNEFAAYWGSPRFTFKGLKETIEIRAPDANNLSNFMAYIAMLKGVFGFVRENDLKLVAEENEEYFIVKTVGGKSYLVIPPFEMLKMLEFQGCKEGFRADDVYRYNKNILNIAKRGLEESEQTHLAPFERMLDERANVSDQLMRLAEEEGYMHGPSISFEGARFVRGYAAQEFERDLETNLK